MTHNHKKALITILLTILIVSFSGCQTAKNNLEISPYADTVLKTPLTKPFPSTTPLPSSTSSVKFTITPTQAPLPKFSRTEAALQVQDLLKTNKGCQLPCWWGIEPGKTSWDDALQFLAPLSNEEIYLSDKKVDGSFSAGFQFFVGDERTGQGYEIRNNLVDFIEVRFGDLPSYSLSDLLNAYGTPEEVWISTIKQDVQGAGPFDLLVGYPNNGILAYFHSMNAKVKGDQIQKCFRDDYVIVLDLWAPGRKQNIESISLQVPFFEDMIAFDKFQRLEMTTGLDTKSFGEIFRDPNNSQCLNTSTKLWKSPFE